MGILNEHLKATPEGGVTITHPATVQPGNEQA